MDSDQGTIIWDVVCFAFLIIQYRVFQSHYFCHVINDTKASTILASRGAELIEELRSKQMQQEIEHEAMILKKLKMKMDRIKATQQKIIAEEPKTHAAGECFRSRGCCCIDFISIEVPPPESCPRLYSTSYIALIVNTFFKVL